METLKLLGRAACPTTLTTVFTATADTAVAAIDIANPSGGTAETVKVTLAGSVLFDVELASGESVSWRGPQLIENADVIAIEASDASLDYHITGVEIT